MNRNSKTALKIGGIIIAVIVILSIVPGLIWGGQGYGYGMMGPGMMGGYGTMFIMPILWIAVIGLIVWAVAAATRRPGESDGSSGLVDSALEILKRRYARGEINKEEYESKKKDIV